MCEPHQADRVLELLREVFDVMEVRGPYANRGESRFARFYVEFDLLPTRRTIVRGRVVRTDRPELGVDAPKQIG